MPPIEDGRYAKMTNDNAVSYRQQYVRQKNRKRPEHGSSKS